MSDQVHADTDLSVTVENIGGIAATEVTLSPGVTVLTGQNATNRTSFLQAIMAAMGSTQASLKADAEEGLVRMEGDDETVTRRLVRAGESVQFEGDGYLEDPTEAELFAFLHGTNDARQAVIRGNDLRGLLMEPIDITAIRREIDRLLEEKGEINDRLATIESRKRELPGLEERRESIGTTIEEKREELSELEAELADRSEDIEHSRTVKEELEETLEELRSVRSDLEGVREDIGAQQDSVDSLRTEQSELEAELAELPESPASERDRLEERIDTLRDRRQELTAEIEELQNLVEYNRDRLSDGETALLEEIDADGADTDGAVTDQLLAGADETVVCWTCGSAVEVGQIEDTIERLESLREEKITDLEDVKASLTEDKDERRQIERKQKRREEIQRRLEDIDAELDRRQDRIDSLKARREELSAEVSSLEADVETYESTDFEDVLSLHREANQLEFEIESLESDREEIGEEITEIESHLEEAEDLREQREQVLDQLAAARTRIDRIEEEAVEAFNEHMDRLLEILEYENLDRIWIERIVEDEREQIDETRFELHVVRSTAGGVAYEDTIDHLSESEREVTGLVFALAGYLVHDLHEEVPVMVLDSLEAIDADRIATLVEYFAEYAAYLVVALLPEDARAVDESYTRVESI